MLSQSPILFIAEKYPPQIGGLSVATERNIEFLAKYFPIVVLNISDQLKPNQIKIESKTNIEIYRLGRSKRTSETLRLAANLIEDLHLEKNFSLLIGFYLVYSGYLAAYYGKLFKRPSLVSIRGNDLDTAIFNSEHFPFVEWTLKNATQVGCVTKSLVSQTKAVSNRKDIGFMPNSVNTDFWHPIEKDQDLLQELKITNEKVFGFVGELRQKKGLLALLRSFAVVVDNFPSRLLLIGGVRQSDKYIIDQFLQQNPHIAPYINVIDYIQSKEELKRYVSVIDFVLFPSLWEGMSNSLLEAMSMAKVVIATSVGGNGEVIEDKKNGFLIERRKLALLGGNLLNLLLTPSDELNLIAQQARSCIIKNFSPETEQSNLLSIVNKLIGQQIY